MYTCVHIWVFYKHVYTCVLLHANDLFSFFFDIPLAIWAGSYILPTLAKLITLPQVSSDNTFNFLFIRCYLSASAYKKYWNKAAPSPGWFLLLPAQQIFSSQLALIRQLPSSRCSLDFLLPGPAFEACAASPLLEQIRVQHLSHIKLHPYYLASVLWLNALCHLTHQHSVHL